MKRLLSKSMMKQKKKEMKINKLKRRKKRKKKCLKNNKKVKLRKEKKKLKLFQGVSFVLLIIKSGMNKLLVMEKMFY